MLILRPSKDGSYREEATDEPTIWLRLSQRKIYNANPDDAQHVLEVVGLSHLNPHAPLGAQIITNLAYNGVPPEVISELNQQSMQETYDTLTAWQGEHAMFRLWDWLYRRGGVNQIRQKRRTLELMPLDIEHYIPKDASLSSQGDDPLAYSLDPTSGTIYLLVMP
jgi:hypothetical protein